MVEAINNVGHVMGKQTIAEFVDSEQVMKALREIGVFRLYSAKATSPCWIKLEEAGRTATWPVPLL